MTFVEIALIVVGLYALTLCAAAGKKTPKP
jgi:hypothetical protein